MALTDSADRPGGNSAPLAATPRAQPEPRRQEPEYVRHDQLRGYRAVLIARIAALVAITTWRAGLPGDFSATSQDHQTVTLTLSSPKEGQLDSLGRGVRPRHTSPPQSPRSK